jgi:hypothetical protein
VDAAARTAKHRQPPPCRPSANPGRPRPLDLPTHGRITGPAQPFAISSEAKPSDPGVRRVLLTPPFRCSAGQSPCRLRQRPEIKRITEQAVAKLNQLSDQAADKLQSARQPTSTEASSSGGPPITVVPETPTMTHPRQLGWHLRIWPRCQQIQPSCPARKLRLLRSVRVQRLPTRSLSPEPRDPDPRQPSKGESSIRTPWPAGS